MSTATTQKTTFSRTTTVQIGIKSSKKIIWNLLTDLADMTRWNSTIISIKGAIKLGEKIELKSTLDESRTFKLKVKALQAEKSMVWGSGMAPFFKGVRTYELKDNADGSIQFTMTEQLGGLTFPMAAKHIPSFDASFDTFAKDLKKEAELQQQNA